MVYYNVLNKLRKKMIQRRHKLFNVGAVVITRNGSPISFGFNSYIKTHPRMLKRYADYKVFVHAECDAIYKIHKGAAAHAIIIARIGSKNQFLLSKPCEGCYREIKAFGIKNIYYTDNNENLVLMR